MFQGIWISSKILVLVITEAKGGDYYDGIEEFERATIGQGMSCKAQVSAEHIESSKYPPRINEFYLTLNNQIKNAEQTLKCPADDGCNGKLKSDEPVKLSGSFTDRPVVMKGVQTLITKRVLDWRDGTSECETIISYPLYTRYTPSAVHTPLCSPIIHV